MSITRVENLPRVTNASAVHQGGGGRGARVVQRPAARPRSGPDPDGGARPARRLLQTLPVPATLPRGGGVPSDPRAVACDVADRLRALAETLTYLAVAGDEPALETALAGSGNTALASLIGAQVRSLRKPGKVIWHSGPVSPLTVCRAVAGARVPLSPAEQHLTAQVVLSAGGDRGEVAARLHISAATASALLGQIGAAGVVPARIQDLAACACDPLLIIAAAAVHCLDRHAGACAAVAAERPATGRKLRAVLSRAWRPAPDPVLGTAVTLIDCMDRRDHAGAAAVVEPSGGQQHLPALTAYVWQLEAYRASLTRRRYR